MKAFMCALALALTACAAIPPTPGWHIDNNKTTWSAACFAKPEGLTRYNLCSLRTGDSKLECENLSLLNYGGEILPLGTSVSVFSHYANSTSKVLISNGDFAGRTLFCETIRLRKD